MSSDDAEKGNLYSAVARIATIDPHRLAVVTPARAISFAMLDAMVAKAGAAMLAAGLETGDRIGISSDDNLLHLVLALACARLGIAQLGISIGDSEDLKNEIVKQLGLATIIKTKRTANSAILATASLLIERDAVLNRDEPPVIRDSVDARLPWLILRSSGTTGSPKYAELTHALAIQRAHLYGELYGSMPRDCFLPLASFDFVSTKQRSIYSLRRGITVCLPDGLARVVDRLNFAKQAGVTLAWATPFHMSFFVSACPNGFPLPAVRAFEANSAVVSEALVREFRELFTPNLHVVYSTNESLLISRATPAMLTSEPGCVGLPTHAVQFEIVDDAGNLLKPNEVGHVRVRSPGTVCGYVNNQAATARSFRNRWFYPGDLASRSPSGAIFLHGRSDDMMIFDGIKIYPAEIERVLATHPAVVEAAAFPIHSQRHQHLPAAAVILKSPVAEEELFAHCRTWLGNKTPVTIRILDSLPRNAGGKVLKRELTIETVKLIQSKHPKPGSEV
jgi:acyl-coenzyme A synthetase/AMP-(fatty) acid ligase